MENSTTDSLNGPPDAQRAKNGARLADAETFKMVGLVASSSEIALCSQADRMMIFIMIASRCRGMSTLLLSGSYVVNSQMVFTPASVRVMLSGAPCWKYCSVHERSRSKAGAVKALEADGFGCWMLTALLELGPDASFDPKIFKVSRRAASDMIKQGYVAVVSDMLSSSSSLLLSLSLSPGSPFSLPVLSAAGWLNV